MNQGQRSSVSLPFESPDCTNRGEDGDWKNKFRAAAAATACQWSRPTAVSRGWGRGKAGVQRHSNSSGCSDSRDFLPVELPNCSEQGSGQGLGSESGVQCNIGSSSSNSLPLLHGQGTGCCIGAVTMLKQPTTRNKSQPYLEHAKVGLVQCQAGAPFYQPDVCSLKHALAGHDHVQAGRGLALPQQLGSLGSKVDSSGCAGGTCTGRSAVVSAIAHRGLCRWDQGGRKKCADKRRCASRLERMCRKVRADVQVCREGCTGEGRVCWKDCTGGSKCAGKSAQTRASLQEGASKGVGQEGQGVSTG